MESTKREVQAVTYMYFWSVCVCLCVECLCEFSNKAACVPPVRDWNLSSLLMLDLTMTVALPSTSSHSETNRNKKQNTCSVSFSASRCSDLRLLTLDAVM